MSKRKPLFSIPIRFLKCGHVVVADRRKHRCCPVCREDLSPSHGVSKAAALRHIRACRQADADRAAGEAAGGDR